MTKEAGCATFDMNSFAQDQDHEIGVDFGQFEQFIDLTGHQDPISALQGQSADNAASPSSNSSGGAPLAEDIEGDAVKSTSLDKAEKPMESKPVKVGSRFTSSAVKALRTWFDTHEQNPYPTPKEIDRLQNRTGLERQQITNWFANTRRRRKFQSHAAPAAQVSSWTESTAGPVDIPARTPTPMPFELMNPLQRWENSPPEHEPALVSDISRAVVASSGHSDFPRRSPVSGRSSENASSIGSTGTSRSSRGSGSNNSAYSYGSRRSAGSRDSNKISNRRRRRGITKSQKVQRIGLQQVRNMYQCTFCTETFKTKYDWQRHEKSLHLSLEQWVCSPNGPTEIHPEKGKVCVYCEESDPATSHLDGHHQAACSERPLEERTFYRKDHMRQHLKLVHGSSQITRLMTDKWKSATSKILSRCGFCGARFETWASRVDHLAHHFKNGSTMAEWEGDWGFEPSVVDMLDNAMPPYLIRFELSAPLPYAASIGPADTSSSAYELLKLEVEYYVRNYYESKQSLPSDDELKYEGCSIIFGAEFFAPALAPSSPSWLRDLFMRSAEIATRARFRPMNQLAKFRMSQLRINGKMNIFEDCELESQLCRYVAIQSTQRVIPNHEIQQAACVILSQVESSSINPSRRFAGFLVRLIWESTDWINPLRQRGSQYSQGTLSQEEASVFNYGDDPNQLNGFYGDLASFGQMSCTAESNPNLASSSNLFQQFGASAARNSQDASLQNPTVLGTDNSGESAQDFYMRLQTAKTLFDGSGYPLLEERPSRSAVPFFLNDLNRYRHLAKELSRFVASTMSPNNPNSHVPTDEEIRHQARWILYDDGDPWNQTPADVEEWFLEFKKNNGLL
ncbi:C2H2 type zinc finger domain-containing protein [Colletotrichum truncatum]|uniref:C2H2 type zinc finger domain-containing protein n=1 Tax=Colletotrichum truncatum TaxID=5467 RepID=A0ACC3ZFR8_COLTU|nr:C2H2 type zinc finger domain-containing protein [Colletotrichum truncatum]KAF6801774.1 C2H2 type zinc finger domain-containing protein [Colletotrichum truncatum]